MRPVKTKVLGRRVVAFLIDAVLVAAVDFALIAALGERDPGPGLSYTVTGGTALVYFALVSAIRPDTLIDV